MFDPARLLHAEDATSRDRPICSISTGRWADAAADGQEKGVAVGDIVVISSTESATTTRWQRSARWGRASA